MVRLTSLRAPTAVSVVAVALVVAGCTRPTPSPVAPPAHGSAAIESASAAAASASAASAPAGPKCPEGTTSVSGGTFARPGAQATAVASFCLDDTEVTLGAYRKCVEGKRCSAPIGYAAQQCNWGRRHRESHPVNCVDQRQATAYCASLGKRLATEAEWDVASRAPSASATSSTRASDPRAVWRADGGLFGRKFTAPVGSEPGAPPNGIRDLAGNVAEWTSSIDEAHPDRFVSRGASFLSASTRNSSGPTDRGMDLGFRCATGERSGASAAPPTPDDAVPTPAAPAPRAPSPPAIVGRGPAMASIPGGTFEVGQKNATSALSADEFPAHRVAVAAFSLDRTEVSVEQFAACVKAGGCHAAPADEVCFEPMGDGTVGGVRKTEKPDQPARCVDLADAKAFCAWANKRLPTEEEWELAARGLEGRAYPWGQAPGPKLACVGAQRPCAVASLPAGKTPEGVLDLGGGVQEWTSTAYCDYSPYGCEIPEGQPFTRGVFVIRDNAFWGSDSSPTRRVPADPTSRSHDLGFRCAHD